MQNRQWNVMASLTVFLILSEVVVVGAGVMLGKDTSLFQRAIEPLTTGMMGYLARWWVEVKPAA